MFHNVFIAGANGNVGSTVVKQMLEKGDIDPRLHKYPIRIIGLASISAHLHNPTGISQERCYEFTSRKDDNRRYELSELLKLVADNPSEGRLTFVDVTAAKEPMRDFHITVMEHTDYGIVASNKNPVTMVDYNAFVRLTKHIRRYGFRCSVMAGANAINEIRDCRDLGDPIRSIEGCFSGTLGYVCSALQRGRKFSEIVAKAKEERYTEPHPADDLSGVDVAKKLLILARTAGIEADLKDISRQPFIPEEYVMERDVNRFMARLPELDKYFSEKVENARQNGQVLRYIARLFYQGNEPRLSVAPELIAQNSKLGMLDGKLNKIIIITDNYTQDQPCTIEAPGAGIEITAQNVRRDILKQIQDRTIKQSNGS